MNKLTETDKLKYWLDAEFSITRAMVAIVILLLVDGFWFKAIIIFYIIAALFYAGVRFTYLAGHDPNFLKIPKQ